MNLRARMGSQRKMLFAVVIGLGLGLLANVAVNSEGGRGAKPAVDWVVTNLATPIGQIFLRLLFLLVIPLLFSALVIGITDLDLKQLRRMGVRMLGYTVLVSGISVVIGMVLVNLIKPGAGLPEETRALARQGSSIAAVPAPPNQSAAQLIVSMVPDNPVKAAANGDVIGVIFFAILFAIALALTPTAEAAKLKSLLQGLYDVLMRLIDIVLKLAPIGVGALLFTLGAKIGVDILRQLLGYVAVVLLGLGLHMFGVYSLTVKFLGGRSPIAFFRDVRLAMTTAFSTASSSATLPTALKVAEENLKLPTNVSRFVLTAGSAMNQNGTALFEGVTVLFMAQVFGVELSMGQQFIVMLICILAGIGTAGVPAGSLPVIAMILGLFGIPPEGLALILGVDRFLDMCRTTVNVTGDLAAAVYVAKAVEARPLQS